MESSRPLSSHKNGRMNRPDELPVPTAFLQHEIIMMQNDVSKKQHRSRQRKRTSRNTQILFLPTAALWVILFLCCVSLPSASGFQPSITNTRNANNVNPAVRTARTRKGATVDYSQSIVKAATVTTTETDRQTPKAEDDSQPSSSTAAFGQWEEVEGNFILRPSIEDGPPRALGT